MAIHCLTKGFAFITAMLSILVLSVSIFVLVSCLTNGKATDGSLSSSENNLDRNNTSSSSFTQNGYNDENTPIIENDGNSTGDDFTKYHSHLNDTSVSPTILNGSNSIKTSTVSVFPNYNRDYNISSEESGPTTESESTTRATPPKEPYGIFMKEQREFWKAKTDTYATLVEASSGTGIFASLLQLCFSWLLICGTAKDMKDRTTIWNLSTFIVYILLVAIILVSLSYNPDTDSFKGTGVFWRETRRKIMQFDYSNIFQSVWNSVSSFLRTDLTFFYYVLGLDALVSMILLIPALVQCIIYPCKAFYRRRKYGDSETDLMIFNGGTVNKNNPRYDSDYPF